VLAGDTNPVAAASGIGFAGAKGEWESFQIIVSPGAPSDPAVDWKPFPTLGASQTWQAFSALYISGLGGGIFPEELVVVTKGAAVTRQTGNTIIWFNFFVPRDAPAGDHVTTVSIGGISIPLRLYVFNFALPDAQVFDAGKQGDPQHRRSKRALRFASKSHVRIVAQRPHVWRHVVWHGARPRVHSV
jgi:hypothetical protein